MSLQTSISEYFNNRKRHAAEEGKRSSKVLILDESQTIDVSNPSEYVSGTELETEKTVRVVERKRVVCRTPSQPRKTPKSSSSGGSKAKRTKEPVKQTDIRKSLFPTIKETSEPKNEEKPVVEFRIGGCLSPMKKNKSDSAAEKQNSENTVKDAESTKPAPSVLKINSLRKDLGLGDLKAKLSRSSRLNDIREALEKLKKGHEKLDNMEEAKAPPKSPSLSQFKQIELEVPMSPSKGMLMDSNLSRSSPSKLREAIFKTPVKSTNLPYISPRKLLDATVVPPSLLSPAKSPRATAAYQRYSGLASAEGRSSLVLPFKYRALAEIFRSVDTVVSIMYNRNETILFPKLKQSVQELNKKNLNESHIAQIKTVVPNAFKFTQEKVRNYSNHGQSEKYELVISPVIEEKEGVDKKTDSKSERFTTSVFLQRKRQFYEALMERTKTYHEAFLSSLDPPMVIPREKLTRWHPEFDLDSCPDIQPSPLPQPPNSNKCSSARDVLQKARDMFVVNHRMSQALESLSSVEKRAEPTPATQAIPALASALKGIPKSLLEKVRARQAAKAMELLTRDPEKCKLGVELNRLPEMARILRNLFVGEKKNVLPQPLIIEKLQASYREILSPEEMEHHINLLIEKVPGWLTTHKLQKALFLKMAKNMEMAKVMASLQEIATQGNS